MIVDCGKVKMSEFIAKAGDKTIEVYQSKPFDKREKWALETLAKELETILEEV